MVALFGEFKNSVSVLFFTNYGTYRKYQHTGIKTMLPVDLNSRQNPHDLR